MKEIKEENLQLRIENTKPNGTVANLEIRVRNLKQHSHQSNIEISGVPETKNEDIFLVLRDIAKAVNIDMDKEKVVAAHRVPSYNRKRVTPIIVKFVSHQERDRWIEGYKQVRPLTADRINLPFAGKKVFINEHLSMEMKLLLSRTKKTAKEKDYKHYMVQTR